MVKLFTNISGSVAHDPLLLTSFHWPSVAYSAQNNGSLTWMDEMYRSYWSSLLSNSCIVHSRGRGVIHLWRKRQWEAGIVYSTGAQSQSASASGGHLRTGASGGMRGRPHAGTHRYCNCTGINSDTVKNWQWQAALLFLQLVLEIRHTKQKVHIF